MEEKDSSSSPADDRVARIAQAYAGKYPWTDYDSLELYYRLEMIGDSLRDLSARVHESFISPNREWSLGVLRALYLAPDYQLSHADIGSATRVPRANVTYQIDRLEKDGFVRRVPHPTDRRVTLVRLTPKGKALGKEILPARARYIHRLTSIFSDEERHTLNALLQRLQEMVDTFHFDGAKD